MCTRCSVLRSVRCSAPARAGTRRCSKYGPIDSWGIRCPTRCTGGIAPRRRSRARRRAIRSRCSSSSSRRRACSTRRGWTRWTQRSVPRSRRPSSTPRRVPTPTPPTCRRTSWPTEMPTLTYRDALNQALREEMKRDPNVFLIGEEVGVYQGAYRVSRGLLEEFGARRVVDTPIAELGFAGIGVGAAMAGLRPVVEFMTWNFALLALDQIVNAAAKNYYMSRRPIPRPIVFRGPNGAALQLAAQHSQAWDSWLAHVPGLKVVSPATPADAKGLLKAAIRDNKPVVGLEGEMLYNTKGDVPDGEYVVPIGKADVKRPGTDVTLVCHSKTVVPALKAADHLAGENGVSAEVVDLRTLRPLDEATILASVAKTNRCVVGEEGWPAAGIGAQVVDVIQREALDQLDAPVLRVTQADVPMPYNKHLERAAKPSVEKIVAAAHRVLYLDCPCPPRS